jgi:RNA polymerase primary sigma factor
MQANPARPILAHTRLDRWLAHRARRPEDFARSAQRLALALDARGIDLEITDPAAWHAVGNARRLPVERQFRAEIGDLLPLERDAELRLALRLEFARIRLERNPQASRRRAEWHALRVEMVERNLYLVLLNVQRYRRARAERADLIQAGAATLFRAVDSFDWRRGVLFRTYAVHWLNCGFRNHLYDFSSTVRVPVYLQKLALHVQAAQQRLGDPHATVDQIAHEARLHPRLVAATRRSWREVRSLDAPLGAGEGAHTLAAELALPDDEQASGFEVEGLSAESGIAQALAQLQPRERRVVELRFGIGCARSHRYAEIAAELGVSLERARQIVLKAISRLRTPRQLRALEPLLR